LQVWPGPIGLGPGVAWLSCLQRPPLLTLEDTQRNRGSCRNITGELSCPRSCRGQHGPVAVWKRHHGSSPQQRITPVQRSKGWKGEEGLVPAPGGSTCTLKPCWAPFEGPLSILLWPVLPAHFSDKVESDTQGQDGLVSPILTQGRGLQEMRFWTVSFGWQGREMEGQAPPWPIAPSEEEDLSACATGLGARTQTVTRDKAYP
jgi:hypothetical protein